jgi:hypothetical protein
MRAPPTLTLNFGDLKKQFYRVIDTIGKMSSGYRENSQYVDELHYLQELDALTDQLHEICIKLSTIPATRGDHLKLKISALVYLLADDAGTELRLAKSLLADLENSSLLPIAAPA